jgi:hypothetical protein
LQLPLGTTFVRSMLIRLGDISPATSKGEKPFTTKDTKEKVRENPRFLGVLRGENVFLAANRISMVRSIAAFVSCATWPGFR